MDPQSRITCKALVLAHDVPCALCQPHAMGVKELFGGGEGIEGLHSDSESRITFWLALAYIFEQYTITILPSDSVMPLTVLPNTRCW